MWNTKQMKNCTLEVLDWILASHLSYIGLECAYSGFIMYTFSM